MHKVIIIIVAYCSQIRLRGHNVGCNPPSFLNLTHFFVTLSLVFLIHRVIPLPPTVVIRSIFLPPPAKDYYSRQSFSPLVHMGGGASVSAMPASEQLTRNTEQLDIKDSKSESEKSYVLVEDEMDSSPDAALGPSSNHSYEATLSVSAAEKWERELLEDPKVTDDTAYYLSGSFLPTKETLLISNRTGLRCLLLLAPTPKPSSRNALPQSPTHSHSISRYLLKVLP